MGSVRLRIITIADSRLTGQWARVVTSLRNVYNPGPREGRRIDVEHSMAEAVTTRLRVGIGHDTHRLTAGGPLRLGGVEIPHDHHLVGHSDADVLLHAVTDAVLGAAGLGDIGELFPDHDPANRGRDSGEMLAAAVDRAAERGFRIVNADVIVFAEQPKLSRYKPLIETRLAELLRTESSNINVKAKTGERVGPIGRQEAISAECAVLLERTDG